MSIEIERLDAVGQAELVREGRASPLELVDAAIERIEARQPAIGAVAGILVTPITLTSYDVGTMLALKGFAAAMLGGMGNPIGAVVGGLLVGLAEALGAGYVSSEYKDAVAFVIILAVLFFLPRGLFGKAGTERV